MHCVYVVVSQKWWLVNLYIYDTVYFFFAADMTFDSNLILSEHFNDINGVNGTINSHILQVWANNCLMLPYYIGCSSP